MAFRDDQETKFKYFCRFCKKGFMCGRALGGHMRAHGIGYEGTNMDDEDPGNSWEDDGDVPDNKHIYALRTNPNRLKSCRACRNCGKEFISWKSFLDHGKCNSDDAESLLLSPPSSDDGEEQGSFNLSKRKMSFDEEDYYAAKCLVMLSNGIVDPVRVDDRKDKGVAKGIFECKACKKVFNSHQALGGHRASHKKVKGCFAARPDMRDDSMENDDIVTHDDLIIPKSMSSSFHASGSSRRYSKVHECTICHRIFSSGQALGGHKRCHWLTSNLPETSSSTKLNQLQDQIEQIQYQRPNFRKSETLDLNFPVLGNDLVGIKRDPNNPLSFEVSTEMNLQSWPGSSSRNYNNDEDKNIIENNNYNDDADVDDTNNPDNAFKDENILLQGVDYEADSNAKLGKFSELTDKNVSSVSSAWLQVGTGLTTNIGSDP